MGGRFYLKKREIVFHVLRACTCASQVRTRLVPQDLITKFDVSIITLNSGRNFYFIFAFEN